MTPGGLNWLGRVLLGPSIWALTFSAVYGAHGTGCAAGWSAIEVAGVSLHRLIMVLIWSAGLGAGVFYLIYLPKRRDRLHRLPVVGAVIGLVSTAFTLMPVLFTSSC